MKQVNSEKEMIEASSNKTRKTVIWQEREKISTLHGGEKYNLPDQTTGSGLTYLSQNRPRLAF